MVGTFFLYSSHVLQRTNFMYKISTQKIYCGLSSSRFGVKIYVHLYLTQTICSVLSLYFSHVETYKIHVEDLNPDNIFVLCLSRYDVKYYEPKHLKQTKC